MHSKSQTGYDSVAQLVEQYTFNVWVLGSSPNGITKDYQRKLKPLKSHDLSGFSAFMIEKFTLLAMYQVELLFVNLHSRRFYLLLPF